MCIAVSTHFLSSKDKGLALMSLLRGYSCRLATADITNARCMQLLAAGGRALPEDQDDGDGDAL
jgi:hypothetical protein